MICRKTFRHACSYNNKNSVIYFLFGNFSENNIFYWSRVSVTLVNPSKMNRNFILWNNENIIFNECDESQTCIIWGNKCTDYVCTISHCYLSFYSHWLFCNKIQYFLNMHIHFMSEYDFSSTLIFDNMLWYDGVIYFQTIS